MRFEETPLAGAFLVDSDALEDQRGSFFRASCRREFEQQGLAGEFVQASISRNRSRGTMRGMHYQAAPRPERKLVRCVRGAVYDVIVDLRRDSATHRRWFGVELSAANGRALYVPAGFAHGFQTLCDDSDVFYQMSEYYVAELSAGVRWDDPVFGIAWPLAVTSMSTRDRGFADYA